MSKHSRPSVISDGATVGVIGAGVMGQTLIRGMIAGGVMDKDRVWAGDKSPTMCAKVSQELGIPVEIDYAKRVPTADVILV